MGFGDSSLFLKITFILLIVGLIIQILGVALPYWYSVTYNNVDYYGGLWRSCTEYNNNNNNYKACGDYNSNLTDWFRATQAFEIIGLLLLAGALILTIIVLFVNNEKTVKLIGWILSFAACGFIIIGIIIYGAEAAGSLAEFSGAFAITIIAGIIAFVAGILGLLDWMGKGQ